MLAENLCLERKVDLYVALMSDVDKVMVLVDNYLSDEGLIKIDGDIAKRSLKQIIKMNGVLLGEVDGEVIGGAAGYTMPGLFTSDVFFSILFFYVKKDCRKMTSSFIKAIEEMLKMAGITKIVFGVPYTWNYPVLSRFYRMMGYSLLESHYCKDI